MAVRGEGLAEDAVAPAAGEDGAASSASQKVVYVLHPNCAVEEY